MLALRVFVDVRLARNFFIKLFGQVSSGTDGERVKIRHKTEATLPLYTVVVNQTVYQSIDFARWTVTSDKRWRYKLRRKAVW